MHCGAVHLNYLILERRAKVVKVGELDDLHHFGTRDILYGLVREDVQQVIALSLAQQHRRAVAEPDGLLLVLVRGAAHFNQIEMTVGEFAGDVPDVRQERFLLQCVSRGRGHPSGDDARERGHAGLRLDLDVHLFTE